MKKKRDVAQCCYCDKKIDPWHGFIPFHNDHIDGGYEYAHNKCFLKSLKKSNSKSK